MERWPKNFLPPSVPRPECCAWPLAQPCLTSPQVGLKRKDFHAQNLEHYWHKFCDLLQLGCIHICHSHEGPVARRGCVHSCCSWHHIRSNSSFKHKGLGFGFFFYYLLFSSTYAIFFEFAADLLINHHILECSIHLSWIRHHFILCANAWYWFNDWNIAISHSSSWLNYCCVDVWN